MIIKAPAKINLGLVVLGRRPDGYHDLESVMQQVSLSDTLVLEPRRSPGWSFDCPDRSLTGPENLVCRAAGLLEREAGRDRCLPGVTITLYKNIPVAAGLGGGSSDAAAALVGLNRFWRLDLPLKELAILGAELGSDVPYCVEGGTVLATGRGERLERLFDLPFYWVVLALPVHLELSTAAVYRSLNLTEARRPPLQELLTAINRRDRALIAVWLNGGCTNTLEDAVLPCYVQLRELRGRFLEAGFDPVMSGSGPSYFTLVDSYQVARRTARLLQEDGYRSFLCWTLGNGINRGGKNV